MEKKDQQDKKGCMNHGKNQEIDALGFHSR